MPVIPASVSMSDHVFALIEQRIRIGRRKHAHARDLHFRNGSASSRRGERNRQHGFKDGSAIHVGQDAILRAGCQPGSFAPIANRRAGWQSAPRAKS